MNPYEYNHPIYQVVINYEEQFSVWPERKELPRGWKAQGKTGTDEECLAYIKERWTEIRPQMLRKKLDELRHKIHVGDWQ